MGRGTKVYYTGFGNAFLDRTPKALVKKKKQTKLDFMKTKQFSASKGTIHRVKEASLVAQLVKNLPVI